MEKKKIESFEDLRVWQKGIVLVKAVLELSRYLSNQIRSLRETL